MKWKQFRLKTTTQAEDIVSSMLVDLGIEGCRLRIRFRLPRRTRSRCSWIFCRIFQKMTEQHI